MFKVLSDRHVPRGLSLHTWDANSNLNELTFMDGDYSWSFTCITESFLQYNLQNVGVQKGRIKYIFKQIPARLAQVGKYIPKQLVWKALMNRFHYYTVKPNVAGGEKGEALHLNPHIPSKVKDIYILMKLSSS